MQTGLRLHYIVFSVRELMRKCGVGLMCVMLPCIQAREGADLPHVQCYHRAGDPVQAPPALVNKAGA